MSEGKATSKQEEKACDGILLAHTLAENALED